MAPAAPSTLRNATLRNARRRFPPASLPRSACCSALTLLALLAPAMLAPAVLAVEPKTTLDVPYAQPADQRRMLDVYAPPDAQKRPVLVWLHGGGWRIGDKKMVQQKPQAFVDKGFVFVAVNYRFVPKVTVAEMTGDVAKAVKWVHANIPQHGGDPQKIFVSGHSAGAHLAALLCTDDRYLKAEGLSLASISGCIPVDTAAYDVPKQVASMAGPRAATYTKAFGRDEASQKNYSPLHHVAADKHIPPFLLLYVADRADSSSQSLALAERLRASGVAVQTHAAENKNHGSINRELGSPSDPPTLSLFSFLDSLLKPAAP